MTDQMTDQLLGRDVPGSNEPISPRHGMRGPRRVTHWEALVEFSAGFLLLALATLAGIVLTRHPGPNRLDTVGYRLLPANSSSHWAHDFASLGSMTALIAGVIVVFLIGFRRDWVRAIACATAPVIAVLIVQEIAKPLVDQQIGGALSYPSGTVAAVAALATALALVTPGRIRLPVAVLGLLAMIGTGTAVVVLRWHYPTDVLGGLGVGMGSVLLVDALLHAPWVIPGASRLLRSGLPAFHERPNVAAARRAS
jgi:membrane-associated phospholipid phosphatase